jgi:regulator of protease activity HflC (stomatin/prohibitin superfamily)
MDEDRRPLAVVQAGDSGVAPPLTPQERVVHGVAPLSSALVSAALVLAGILILGHTTGARPGERALGVIPLALGALTATGFTTAARGQARVLEVFGQYHGTIREAGLRWVGPWVRRRKLSVRLRNYETTLAKVNDANGSPIDIAAVVVWQVKDTARAIYDVEALPQFVAMQTDTAVRHVATIYPYEPRRPGNVSLRDSGAEVNARLASEISARVAVAGVAVVEARLSRLAYAPEIAQFMLRRQEADAIVAARQRIVEGAVGMVQLALARLEDENLVVLNDERRVAMVSNLLTVLCSDEATRPVINTGTLYQ